MKKTLLLVTLLVGLFINCFAQITINRTDIGTTGDWFYMAYDTTPVSAKAALLKPGGLNKTWDISGWIKQQKKDTTYFADAASYPDKPNECNLVILAKNQTPAFMLISSANLKRIYKPGDIISAGGQLKELQFPSAMGVNFKDSLKSVITNLATAVGFPSDPAYDSVKINFSVTRNAIIDGWGKLSLYANQFDVIRQKTMEQLLIGFTFRNKNTGTYNITLAGADFKELNTMYAWYANNGGDALLRATEDTTGKISKVVFMLASSKGLRTFINEPKKVILSKPFPNPAYDILQIEFNSLQNCQAVLKMSDMLGNEVLVPIIISVSAGFNLLSVNLSTLNSGLYFYTITGNGFLSSNRFMVR